MIPVVPESCLELLEAPVPCILGMERSSENINDITTSMFTQETLIVLLDKNKIMHYNGNTVLNSLKKLPSLSDLRGNIMNSYSIFEKEKKDLLKNYCITEKMKKSVEEISNKIELGIKKAIINYLPLIPPRIGNKVIDLEKVKKLVLDKIKPIDEDFLKLFCETQMFATYVDEVNEERCSFISSLSNS